MALVNTIIAEIMKLKRSSTVWLSILMISVSPLLNILIYFNTHVRLQVFDNNIIMLNIILVFPFLYGIIITYLFNREYQEDMMKTLLTVPVSKSNLIFSKIILLIMWSMLLGICSSLITVILGSFIGISQINISSILDIFLVNLKTCVMYVLCMLPIVIVAIVSKMGYVSAMGACTVITIGNFLVNGGGKIACMYPWTIVSRFGNENLKINYAYPAWVSALSIISVAVISLLIALKFFKTQDN
jgi:bacitracin transport system permease protein